MTEVVDVVIIGAGGHGRELADVARACIEAGRPWRLRGLVDDDPTLHGRTFCDLTVLGSVDWLRDHIDEPVVTVVGIGDPHVRRRVARRAAAWGVRWATLVHPDAVLTPYVELGPGVVITAGCVLTNSIVLGPHAHLNRRATVGHDSKVGAYVHLAPGSTLSGTTTIGEGSVVGTHACLLPGVSVGPWSMVGAGAVVCETIPANVTAVGVPARVVSRRAAGWHEDPTA
ncbi:MAG: acetyltransferase [Deltaproteobacteria bacterium]|nr:acetyltransferase [Deltaproteobacteria bacterium]